MPSRSAHQTRFGNRRQPIGEIPGTAIGPREETGSQTPSPPQKKDYFVNLVYAKFVNRFLVYRGKCCASDEQFWLFRVSLSDDLNQQVWLIAANTPRLACRLPRTIVCRGAPWPCYRPLRCALSNHTAVGPYPHHNQFTFPQYATHPVYYNTVLSPRFLPTHLRPSSG